MANVFIIHGAYEKPSEIWFPWLKNQLKKLGQQVYIPRFPTPKNQNLKNWLSVFKKNLNGLNKNSMLVGHSLGPAFILNVLEKINTPIKAVYFIAPFIGKLGNPQFDTINQTFCQKKFNWPLIRKNCQKFYLYTSKNDPYVPIQKAIYLGQKLKTKPIVMARAGHFQTETGYGQKFKKLLQDIKKELPDGL